MIETILEAFGRTAFARDLPARLPPASHAVRLAGLPGSSGAVLAAWLAEQLRQRLFTVIAATPADAERWLADLAILTGHASGLYPQREALGEAEPHLEIAGERVETLEALLRGQLRILVTTARATAEKTLMPQKLERLRLGLGIGMHQPLRAIAERLAVMGYRRVPVVTEVAEFSVRGGIIDFYGFGMAAPARVEWWGDEISSIRTFDLTTQRSGEALQEVTVLPIGDRQSGVGNGEWGMEGNVPTPHSVLPTPEPRRTLLDLLPADTLVLEEAAHPNAEEVARAWREAEHHLEIARRLGESLPPREELLADPSEWSGRLTRFPRILLREAQPDLQAGFLPPDPIDRNLGRLRAVLGGGTPTLILCDNAGQLERLEELLFEPGVGSGSLPLPTPHSPLPVQLAVGALDGGFVMPTLRVLTDHEIFRRARRLRRVRRYRQAAPSLATGALTAGDYVVHLDHGIGIYRGIQMITAGDAVVEAAVVEYEGGDRLNVPLYRLDQLERYRGGASADGEQAPPRLHRLGGSGWRRQRDRTHAAIRQMAAELLDLYARRKLVPGYAFGPDTRWQRELESAFLYEDTADQRKATEDVKRDMERPVPMDRLLVGDVGYGKTEVAIRAGFKAVQEGKQVAVLVPTTILADQHGRTFTERLADYPVRIAVLSRFLSSKEQKDLLRQLASGAIDIVIGTHRLLSADVQFKDLGLLVVDEEHRFGVRHKERLKEFRLSIDVLTLTATPIPRTLHLSLAGLRDLTLIETPPRDRSPILTFVEPWDDALIEEAIARELDRGGQVFFVHNRIETIETIAARVRHLAPRARLGVAHGQMPAEALERVMLGFVRSEVDILVSTMIVESGLDVPNANTMVVHDAHRLGLAQLYQLRGRVGRSHRRAYCYLITPDVMDPAAEDRLKVLEHHTDLGAGYRIALKDLEIRGAGNLLGAEQSGHAQAVGFDLYLRWLEETVASLRAAGRADGQAVEQPPEVVFDGVAALPDPYVPDEDTKLDLYRRLARATRSDEIQELRQELRERFGPLPVEAERLVDLGQLRVLGGVLGIQHILVRGDEARITFRAGAAPRLTRLTLALDNVQLAADVRRTVPLAIRLVRLGGESLVPALVRALGAVSSQESASRS